MNHDQLTAGDSQSSQHAKSAMISIGITTVVLIGLYFAGGQQILRTVKTTEKLRDDQNAAQMRIDKNASHVNSIREDMESMRNMLNENNGQQLNMEELRQRFAKIEQALTAIPPLTDVSRTEIDGVTSQNALLQAEAIAIRALAGKCEQALRTTKEATVTWERDYAPLLTNNRGRQIAADENAVQNFATVLVGDFPNVAESINWLAEFEAAVRPIREASAKGRHHDSVTANDRAYFEELLSRANAANQRLEQRRRTVDAILAVTSQNDPGPTTLKQHINHLNSEKMLSMVEEATRVRHQKLQQTIQEQSDVIFDAEAERLAAETQLRVQQEKSITHAASRKSEDLKKDEELARAKAQKRQLEKDFVIDLREIKILLGTFFVDGYAQPVSGDPLEPIEMKLESWHIPVKLGRLRSAGALEQTTDGNENLYFFGGCSQNDRPKTGFPNHTPNGLSNPAVAKKVKRASELLNKYGDLLVEKKLLAP